MKTKRHSDVILVGCTLSSCLCVHTSGEDGTKKKSETVSNREWVCVLGGDTFGWDLGATHSPNKKDLQTERSVSNLTLSERAAHL